MKPFFSYYGSKYRLSQTGFYPDPISDTVVELFAGSATYSTYHNVKNAILVEINPDIVAIWEYLINASEDDILSLPTNLTSINDIEHLELGAKNLIKFWFRRCVTSPANQLSSWYFKYKDEGICRVWNQKAKERIISQLESIRQWQVVHMSYLDFDFNTNGLTYFIDPPYSGPCGNKYPYKDIDYMHLSDIVNKLSAHNQVIACENSELTADWANFANGTSKTHRGMRKETLEVCYAN